MNKLNTTIVILVEIQRAGRDWGCMSGAEINKPPSRRSRKTLRLESGRSHRPQSLTSVETVLRNQSKGFLIIRK